MADFILRKTRQDILKNELGNEHLFIKISLCSTDERKAGLKCNISYWTTPVCNIDS